MSQECSGLVSSGQWYTHVEIVVFNLAFTMVFGMLRLKAVELCIDQSNDAVVFQHSSCWILLPSQLSDTLLANFKPRLFTIESAAQFAKTLKQYNECYCLMLNFTHHAAYGGDKVAEVNQRNEQILDELKKKYPAVFSEPPYPI